MTSLDQKIFCEIFFRDFRTNKVLRVIGKTNIDNLISPKKKFILIENIMFQKQKWEKILSKVPKVDIIRICAFKAQIFLNYEKGNLILDSKGLNELEITEKFNDSPLII